MTTTVHPVVVGIDGSPASEDACRYACAEASARRLPITLVHTWQPYPVYADVLWNPVPWAGPPNDPELTGQSLLQTTAAMVKTIAPDVECHTLLLELPPAAALIELSKRAALVVVGGRDREGHEPGWLGSVALRVASQADCPVVAVPTAPRVSGDVVVGVDGSAVSAEAIGFAFDQAALWRSGLRAVLAFPAGYAGVALDSSWLARLHEEARSQLSESLAGWREKYPDVPVTELVSGEHPLRALRLAAEDAGLLVMGSHGRGAAMRFALGSVSSSLLRVATCPVAIVRAGSTS
jgi:nucleotide-binding universal stress UspA family protein